MLADSSEAEGKVAAIRDTHLCGTINGLKTPIQMQEKQTDISSRNLYTAPELIQGKRQSPESDIWSLGIILFQLAYGKLPFTNELQIREVGILRFPSWP